MPQFDIKTVSSKQVWSSPDGQRTIYEVMLEVDGKQVKASTYSDRIAQVGFSGEVQTYEKEGRNGPQTFVKQVPKEGGGYGGNYGGSGGRSSSGSYTPKDENAIKAMWAIGQATTVVTGAGIPFSEKEFYPSVQAVASTLFEMVEKVKTGETASTAPDTVHDVPDEPMSLADLDAALGGEPVDAGETPWPNSRN